MKKSRCAAFTRWEVLAMVAAILILASLFLPSVPRTGNSRSTHMVCINNLKQVALGLNIWIHDNEADNVPWQIPTAEDGTRQPNRNANAWSEYYFLRKELDTPKTLHCPADKTKGRKWAENWDEFKSKGFTNNSVSYFINLDAGTSTNKLGRLQRNLELMQNQPFAGDRNIGTEEKAAGCATGVKQAWTIRPATSPVGWTNNPSLHPGKGNLAIIDGRVETVDSEGLREAMSRTDDNGSVHLLLP